MTREGADGATDVGQGSSLDVYLGAAVSKRVTVVASCAQQMAKEEVH